MPNFKLIIEHFGYFDFLHANIDYYFFCIKSSIEMHSVYTNLSSFKYYAWCVCEAIALFLAGSLEKMETTDMYALKCVYIYKGKEDPT